MTWLMTILGGIVAIGIGTQAVAEPLLPTMRPMSREDGAVQHAAAARAALAQIRPLARPDYMLRYPVVVRVNTGVIRPQVRSTFVPNTRWESRPGSVMWTRAAMSAVESHSDGLTDVVPRDIASWCPAYAANPPEQRSAFWVGMMSALAKHESTYNPRAVGGGGLWYGLLQILPSTARLYGCRARTGEALTDPEDNLSCAVRIMTETVRRDNAVALLDRRWRGVAADWGPMTNRSKIAEMSAWTSQQSYCVPLSSVRPRARPARFLSY